MATEQIGQALPFFAFYTNVGVGVPGLAVSVDVYRAGALIVSGAVAIDLGAGLYEYILPASWVTLQGVYQALFKTASPNVDAQQMPADWEVGETWVERLDVAVSSRLAAGGGTVTLTAPFAASTQTFYLIAGDAYLVVLGTAITINLSGSWNLTGATVLFFGEINSPGTAPLSTPVTVLQPTNPQQLQLELTAAQTLALKNDGACEIRAYWTDTTKPITLLRGVLSIQSSLRNPLV